MQSYEKCRMKQIALIFSVLVMWSATAPRAAEPLAQKYVVVHHVRNLDNPKQAVCVGTPDIIKLPSGRLIASASPWSAMCCYQAQ